MTYRELVAWRFTFLSGLGLLTACGSSTTDNSKAKEPVKSEPTNPDTPGSDAGKSGSDAATRAPVKGGLCEASDREVPVGHASCANGIEHRPAPVECPNTLADREPRELGEVPEGSCASDAECTEHPYGHCEQSVGQIYALQCEYGCVADSDCAEDELCSCGPDIGECIPADCKTDDDCDSGLCAIHRDAGECVDGFGGPVSYACITEQDECFTDADCSVEDLQPDPERTPDAARCAMVDGARKCQQRNLCGIGRPFLVRETARLAETEQRQDWSQPCLPASTSVPMTASQRERVAEEWTQIALMEHASIAAFARFQLQLLSFGAPAALVEATNAALADETRHAKACFAQASEFSGKPLGPGSLAIEGALAEVDLRTVALTTVLEGCIGETVAAVEAEWGSKQAAAQEVMQLLSSIAQDETRHAELAWQFLDWAASKTPGLLDEAIELAQSEHDSALQIERTSLESPDDAWLAGQGLVPQSVKDSLKVNVLREVVLPCLEALRAAGGGQTEQAA